MGSIIPSDREGHWNPARLSLKSPRFLSNRWGPPHHQCRGMDRDQTILAELGPPDVENTSAKIDVGAIEPKRFAGTQARARQQSNESRQHQAPLGISR